MRKVHLDKGSRFNADGEGTNMSQTSLEFNAIGHCWQAKDARARRQEMTRIVVCMKPNEVAKEDAEEDFATNRKDARSLSAQAGRMPD